MTNYVPHNMRVLALALLLTVQACDSEPGVTVGDGPPDYFVDFIGVDQEEVFYAGPDTLIQQLDDLFSRHGDEQFYEVDNPSGNLSISVSGPRSERLSIVAPNPGLAQLVVKVLYRGVVVSTGVIDLMFLEPCPPPAKPNEVDYFPIHLGDEWTFSYKYSASNSSGIRTVQGDLTWEVVSANECIRGTSEYQIKSYLDVTVTERNIFAPTETWHSSYLTTNSVVVSDSVHMDWFFSKPIPRYLAVTSPDTVGFGGTARANFFYGRSDWGHPNVRLAKNSGVVGRSMWVHAGVASDIIEGINLRSRDPQ